MIKWLRRKLGIPAIEADLTTAINVSRLRCDTLERAALDLENVQNALIEAYAKHEKKVTLDLGKNKALFEKVQDGNRYKWVSAVVPKDLNCELEGGDLVIY